MPYQAVQHLNQKPVHPVLVFSTLASFAQVHHLQLMLHSDHSDESLLIYYVQDYGNHFSTGCAQNFLGLLTDYVIHFWQDCQIRSVHNYRNDSELDFPIHS